jgi:hypothetical protein
MTANTREDIDILLLFDKLEGLWQAVTCAVDSGCVYVCICGDAHHAWTHHLGARDLRGILLSLHCAFAVSKPYHDSVDAYCNQP